MQDISHLKVLHVNYICCYWPTSPPHAIPRHHCFVLCPTCTALQNCNSAKCVARGLWEKHRTLDYCTVRSTSNFQATPCMSYPIKGYRVICRWCGNDVRIVLPEWHKAMSQSQVSLPLTLRQNYILKERKKEKKHVNKLLPPHLSGPVAKHWCKLRK